MGILPIVAAALIALGCGIVIGCEIGGRRLWNVLMSDRRSGHAALEQLASRHGAKLEIWQGPGG